jgi:hypothetical protein
MYKTALQHLVDAIWDCNKAYTGDHPVLDAALEAAEKILAEPSCPEFITEECLTQNSEPCVPGDWPCQLAEGHDGTHQHTHTFEWNSA